MEIHKKQKGGIKGAEKSERIPHEIPSSSGAAGKRIETALISERRGLEVGGRVVYKSREFPIPREKYGREFQE